MNYLVQLWRSTKRVSNSLFDILDILILFLRKAVRFTLVTTFEAIALCVAVLIWVLLIGAVFRIFI